MDELAQARVKLNQLEEVARKLLKLLLDVRAIIAAQRANVNELSRTNLRPSTINRLPTEILVIVLDLAIHTRHRPERKQKLAGVCRHWRDVILQTPCFWSTIHVASDASSINTHLERSRGTLLDIVIEGAPRSPSKHLALHPGLETVMTCARRWRSLLVIADYSSDDYLEEEDEELLTDFIADRINHLHFPSLKRVTILPLCDVGYLAFLSTARAPALEHLELHEFMITHDTLNPVAMLKTLRLNFDADPFIDHLLCWSLVRTQTLTKISFTGDTEAFLLQTNSICFPSLMSLELDRVTKTRPILDAIVAPYLEQFNYTFLHCDDSPSVALSGFGSKFTNVRQLSLSRSGRWDGREVHRVDALPFCEAFPGVHHVELDGVDWPYLFDPSPIQSEPGPNSHIRYPIDLWTELKSFTFNGLHDEWLKHDQPMAWLVHRRASGLQQLHVKVKVSNTRVIDRRDIGLYERLKENCTLELDGFSSLGFSGPWNASPTGVSSFLYNK